MNLTDLLKGKKVKYMTEAKVEVVLEIDSAETKHYYRDLEEATPANDWWPRQETWQKIKVTFTNGFTNEYSRLEDIKEA